MSNLGKFAMGKLKAYAQKVSEEQAAKPLCCETFSQSAEGGLKARRISMEDYAAISTPEEMDRVETRVAQGQKALTL